MRGGAVDAGRARRFVHDVLQHRGINGDALDDAVLGASELATNAIRHAGGVISVRVDADDRSVRVEVEDAVAGEVFAQHPDLLDTSGRGLCIVEGLSSRWGTDASSTGGKFVWFELDREAASTRRSLSADLGERDGRRLLAPQALVGIIGTGLGVALAAETSSWMQPELAVSILGAGLVLIATLLGGFPAGVASGIGLGVGVLVFEDESRDLSPLLLAVAVALGAVVVAFFAWAGLQLRSRARKQALLLQRLAALNRELASIEDADDPIAEVERIAAAAAGARRAEILATMPAVAESVTSGDVAVLPLDGPQRHRALVLRMVRSGRLAVSEERDAFHHSIADRCAQSLERIELREAEQRARADLEVLAEASRVLVGSLDIEKVAAGLRDVLVPGVADELEVELGGQGVDLGEEGEGSADVAQFDLRSRDRTLGTLTARRFDGPFDDDDRTLLAEIATRAAAALDIALLYTDQMRTNKVLEHSLLPSAFLRIDHLDVGARYLASVSGHDVGGDFYDVLPTPQGDMALIVGDVQGKGIEAATLTALSRHTLRSAALAGAPPARMLARLNQALRWEQAERELVEDDPLARFVTAAVAVLHPTETGFRATVSRAGHPLPIVVRPAGDVEHLDPDGTILGAFDDAGCTEVEVDLGLSDILVLYTDGVVEHRAAADLFDELQLGRLLRNQLTVSGADDLAGLILDTVLALSPTESRDDIAILVARVTGPR